MCSACAKDEFCENIQYYVQYAMSSWITINILLEESIAKQIALKFFYIFLFSMLTLSSLINNYLSIATCFIRRIRITICGCYIILYSISSCIAFLSLQIITVVVLFYNDQLKKNSIVYCNLIPTVLYLMYYLCRWLSAFIAVERALIQFFNYSIYRTRTYATMFSLILFVFLIIVKSMETLGMTVEVSPVVPTSYVCALNYKYFPNDNKKLTYIITNSIYLHIVVPWLLNVLSIILTLTHIIRLKIQFNDLQRNSWLSLILQQISRHKDFFVSPLVIIICTLPEILVINIVDIHCVDKSKQKLYIILHFIHYMPLMLTFFVYIYPSNVYMSAFSEMKIIRWIKCKMLSYGSWCRTSIVFTGVMEETIDEQIEETHF